MNLLPISNNCKPLKIPLKPCGVINLTNKAVYSTKLTRSQPMLSWILQNLVLEYFMYDHMRTSMSNATKPIIHKNKEDENVADLKLKYCIIFTSVTNIK